MLLCLVVGAWNYFLSPGYLTPILRDKIASLTGAEVELVSAEFSLFKGLDLKGLSIRPAGDPSAEAILTAQAVHLEYRLWNFIAGRSFGVERIVCYKPNVTLDYFRGPDGKETTNLQQLFGKLSSGGGNLLASIPADSLPVIEFQQGRIRRIDRTTVNVKVMEKEFHCVMVPDCQGEYRGIVEIAGRTSPIWLRYACNLTSGTLRLLGGSISTEALEFLPPKYHDLVKRYQLRGEFLPVEQPSTSGDSEQIELELKNFSLRLPTEDGDLTLRHVRGRVSLGDTELKVDLKGTILEFGDAEIIARGRFSGIKSPAFELDIWLGNVRLPKTVNPDSPLAELLGQIHRDFQIEGTGNIAAHFSRSPGGKTQCRGYICPQRASGRYSEFPLPLHDITGRIEFDETGIRRIDLNARKGDAVLHATGELQDVRYLDRWRTIFDVTITAQNLALDKDLHNALPPEGLDAWKEVDPAGSTDTTVHIFRHNQTDKLAIAIDIRPRGNLTLRCAEFPYPLRNCTGRASVANDAVIIHDLRSHHGDFRLSASGYLRNLSTKTPDINLQIAASQMPFDKTLRDVLPKELQTFLNDLKLSGMVNPIQAKIRQTASRPLHYDVRMGITGGALDYTLFPYALTNVTGQIRVMPEMIRIESLRGEHGSQVVTAAGHYAPQKTAQDEYTILITADGASLDGDFLKAANANKQLSKGLAPFHYRGKGNLRVQLTQPTMSGGDIRYAALLKPLGGSLLWDELPYTLDDLRGEVLITPDRVTLRELRGTHGKAAMTVSGTADLSSLLTRAQLSLRANAPVDADLLRLFKHLESPLDDKLQAGGTLAVDLQNLNLTWRTAPQTKETTFDWAINGLIGFDGAQYKNDPKDKTARTLTGQFNGQFAESSGVYTANAEAKLKRFEIEHVALTDVRTKLLCTVWDKNTLRVKNLSGRCATGKIAGDASIKLDGETDYEFDLSMVDVPLGSLLSNAASRKLMKGSLQGRLAMHYRGGKKRIRQAEGRLEIVRGELYRLPVFLEALNVIALQLPGNAAFQSGEIHYTLRGDTLYLREIVLTGKALSVVGSGTINLKTDAINLTFLTGPPGKLPRLGEIAGDILRAIAGELIEIRVTGTTANPKMTPMPLRSINALIKTLLAPLKAR